MKALTLSSVGVLSCVLLSSCAGPRPEIVATNLQPPTAPGSPYIVTALVRNNGGGEGQIEAVARVIARASGRTVAQRHEQADLRPYETVRLVFLFPDVPPADYRVEVKAVYPP